MYFLFFRLFHFLEKMKTIFISFFRDKKASVFMEYVFILPLSLGMIFGIIDANIVSYKLSAMEFGIEEAKRMIVTGQIRNGVGSQQQQLDLFKKVFCSKASVLIECSSVFFDVRTFADFGSTSMPTPIVNGVVNTSGLGFNIGGTCKIVGIRAYYTTFSPTRFLFTQNDDALDSGKIILVASTILRIEPFDGKCS